MHARRGLFVHVQLLACLIKGVVKVDGLRIATFNIRQDDARNATKEPIIWKEHPWTLRGAAVVKQIKTVNPDIIGLQEVSDYQLKYLKKRLGRYGYSAASLPQQASPIFYRASVLKLSSLKRFWLSETPQRPSRGWDGKFEASALLVDFRYSSPEGDAKIRVFNAHFDYAGSKAREESSKLVLRLLQPHLKHGMGDALTLLIGDLNQEASGEPGYGILTVGGQGTFIDTRLAAKAPDVTTFTDFMPDSAQRTIDYILVQNNGLINSRWDVASYDVVSNVGPQGYRISDHQMVTTEFERT